MITHKIFGPPGTGKTTRLTELMALEKQAGTPLHRIGFLSFSKAANEVIIQKMAALPNDVRWFRTIHGACVKHLGMSGAIVGWRDYRAFSNKSGMKITPEEMDNFDDDELTFNNCLRALNLSRTSDVPIEVVLRRLPPHPNLTLQRVMAFDRAWNKYKREVRRFDYTDMLTEYARIGTPLDLDVGILDEAQDLTMLQWRIVHTMFANVQRFYMAGDDDQAIYQFIGGSEYAFLEHPCDEEETLVKSYRVPKLIGREADRIIKRIKRRKAKMVRWKDEPGHISRMNLDADTIPWRQWLPKYESVMVLTRHRKGARLFSDGLKSIGVPHSLHGESISEWREARIVSTILALREGRAVTSTAARALLTEIGKPTDRLADVAKRDRLNAKDLPEIDLTSPWVGVLACGDRKKARKYEAIRKLIHAEGSEALAKDPKVMVSTMHAAKGKEADLVVIQPDCTPIVHSHLREPTENRLSYVALTRTKKQAVVLMPRTDMYINHYFGG